MSKWNRCNKSASVCRTCGNPIQAGKRHLGFCSWACREEWYKLHKKPATAYDPTRKYEACSTDVIQSARTKPEGCSDIRWRMELDRRARPEACDLAFPEPVRFG